MYDEYHKYNHKHNTTSTNMPGTAASVPYPLATARWSQASPVQTGGGILGKSKSRKFWTSWWHYNFGLWLIGKYIDMSSVYAYIFTVYQFLGFRLHKNFHQFGGSIMWKNGRRSPLPSRSPQHWQKQPQQLCMRNGPMNAPFPSSKGKEGVGTSRNLRRLKVCLVSAKNVLQNCWIGYDRFPGILTRVNKNPHLSSASTKKWLLVQSSTCWRKFTSHCVHRP